MFDESVKRFSPEPKTVLIRILRFHVYGVIAMQAEERHASDIALSLAR